MNGFEASTFRFPDLPERVPDALPIRPPRLVLQVGRSAMVSGLWRVSQIIHLPVTEQNNYLVQVRFASKLGTERAADGATIPTEGVQEGGRNITAQ